jgi:hypothetical protein
MMSRNSTDRFLQALERIIIGAIDVGISIGEIHARLGGAVT